MSAAKYLTSGALASPSKPGRMLAKDQEVVQLVEQIEDLETSISVNMQLMQEIATARPVSSTDDTENSMQMRGKVYEKLLEQRKRLESALDHVRAQRNLCFLKISRSEEDTSHASRCEESASVDLTKRIEAMRKVVEERERTIQTLEDTLSRLESEHQACKDNKICVVDLPGTELRVARLTRAVRQDEQIAQVEKLEALEKCKNIEVNLQQERMQFSSELHCRHSAAALSDDFGLYLTYENYLLPEKPSDVSVVTVAQSSGSNLMEEAKAEQMHAKSKSEWSPSMPPADSGKMDPTTTKLEEVCLAMRMKSEEMVSLRKLSSYLDSQKVLLAHKLQQLKSKIVGENPLPSSPTGSPEPPLNS